jgi:hypothetical protein
MDEHPGDTLGKRFLTFWGALAAIVAVAALLGLYRWIALPSDTATSDGGAGKKRLDILTAVTMEQQKELTTAAEVDKDHVRIPPALAVPYAVNVLAGEKAAPSPIKTFAALAAEAEAKAAANPAPPPAPPPAPTPAPPPGK